MPRKDYRFYCKRYGCRNRHGKGKLGRYLCADCEAELITELEYRNAIQWLNIKAKNGATKEDQRAEK